MITVLGPKGGTGKTVTSSNLAVALALEGRSSVLVDLDLQFGDVGLALGLEPTKTIYDLATSGGTLDGDKVDELPRPASVRARVRCWRRCGRIRRRRSRRRSCGRCSRSSARGTTSCIVDTPPAFTPEVIAAVDASSHLLHGRDARRALAQGHEDRPRDAGGDGLRPAGDHARAQPRRLERRHHASSTSSSCSAARRTCSSAATARSPARSRAVSRSWSPSRSRRRPGRTPRSPSATWRSRRLPVAARQRQRAAAAAAAEGELTMELHERIANSPVGPAIGGERQRQRRPTRSRS